MGDTNVTLLNASKFPEQGKIVIVHSEDDGDPKKEFITLSLKEQNNTHTNNSDNNNLPDLIKKPKKGWRKYSGILFTVAAAMQFALSALTIKILNS